MVENGCRLAELVAAGEIMPGIAIEGFTEAKQLDTFVESLRKGVMLRHQAEYLELEIVAPRDNVFSALVLNARPKKLVTARVMDIRAAFLTPDISLIKNNPGSVERDTVITFLATALARESAFGIRGSVYVRTYNHSSRGVINAVMMYTSPPLGKRVLMELTNQRVPETPGKILTWVPDDLEGRVVVN